METGSRDASLGESTLPEASGEVAVAKWSAIWRGEHQCVVTGTDVFLEVLAQHRHQERRNDGVPLLVGLRGPEDEGSIHVGERTFVNA